jgi:hypothetical protein
MATFDRAFEDVGNIVALEHVNLWVTDQRTATAFYIYGLGFTRDPYLMVNIDNMWVNLGKQQFHLITKPAQVLRGTIGLVLPSLDRLVTRLKRVRDGKLLDGTKFDFSVEDKTVVITCPYGNTFRAHGPGPDFPNMTLGMPYVEFTVSPGQAPAIAKFYDKVFEAASCVTTNGVTMARVKVGPSQEFRFKETAGTLPAYDGHHVAVYVSNFSRNHDWLAKHGLVTEESNPYQYRFNWISDADSGAKLFEVEHEVRSLTHPMYMRALVNRNPSQTQREYVMWADPYFAGAE